MVVLLRLYVRYRTRTRKKKVQQQQRHRHPLPLVGGSPGMNWPNVLCLYRAVRASQSHASCLHEISGYKAVADVALHRIKEIYPISYDHR